MLSNFMQLEDDGYLDQFFDGRGFQNCIFCISLKNISFCEPDIVPLAPNCPVSEFRTTFICADNSLAKSPKQTHFYRKWPKNNTVIYAFGHGMVHTQIMGIFKYEGRARTRTGFLSMDLGNDINDG